MGGNLTQATRPGGNATFTDLPAALVEEVLQETTGVAERLLASFQDIRKERGTLRERLLNSGLVVQDTSLGTPPPPTTCAADGSYAIDRLLTTDLAAAAAVAVEGLVPPSEERHWEQPRHRTFVAAEPHVADTATVLRAVMLGEELRLLAEAPHDLAMLDGTFTLPVIYFNQAFSKARDANHLGCSQRLLRDGLDYLETYRGMLRADHSGRYVAALPKYTTRREIGRRQGWPEEYDDRGILTMLLEPGELTRPVPFEHPRNRGGELSWHLGTECFPKDSRPKARGLVGDIVAALESLRIFYYKPRQWLPAIRVEIVASVASDTLQLATVVRGVKSQTATASMLEPYPIYLADRTARALARALPAFRQVTTQRISERYRGDIGEVFFAMHGYRSESGR